MVDGSHSTSVLPVVKYGPMDATPSLPPPRPRNRVTQARHQREAWLQIYLPLSLFALVFLAAAVLTLLGAFGAAVDNSVMADTAAVWLSLPVLFAGLVLLAVVGGLAYGVSWLAACLPPYLKQGQDLSRSILDYSRRYADRAARPVVAVSARAAGVQRFLTLVRESFRRNA